MACSPYEYQIFKSRRVHGSRLGGDGMRGREGIKKREADQEEEGKINEAQGLLPAVVNEIMIIRSSLRQDRLLAHRVLLGLTS